MTFRNRKMKKRSMTPDYLAKQEDQDAELNRELLKTVTLGQDIEQDYEKILNTSEMDEKIKRGI